MFLALMPYHVLVSRQVLLDLPEAFCATLTLYFLALYVRRGTRSWLYAAGGGLGLTFLSKEVGILFVGAVYAFLALSPSIRVRLRDLAVSLARDDRRDPSVSRSRSRSRGSRIPARRSSRTSCSGGRTTASSSIRRASPRPSGLLLLIVARRGARVLLRHERDWRETLLLAWIVVPAIFFELWPVKGFQYLLPIASAVRAPGGAGTCPSRGRRDTSTSGPLAGPGGGSARERPSRCRSALSSWARIHPPRNGQFLAGSGGVPGGREAGQWVEAHVPAGAQMLAIGPSMANILEFYGHRMVFGLSVSANPLRRNPVYEAVRNPDLMIRHNDIQYVVWDSFSASRSHFFSDKILAFARRYNGRVEHTETITVKTADGREVRKPVIVIYSVRP